ncbi:coiled-coil-helix-coiled-coil-helix domain containing 3a isoform X2 [Poeciliopsis prolifica]|uniref:coiled-coil-helix-coiled-coil-helix domain containing 3a isoform X2 n=1 Tax=Poeciliopsis prolifica TaxID=188132 RepID=UPI0024133DED|nr:coiled-coil-helix-coiled-coil-helix domain containing 3a isoform X2 [Poeciliopsis prolifica]
MGANNSTRRVSFESDENDNITVVKGIRLSENVIKRMKEPTSPPKQQQRTPTSAPPKATNLIPSPLLRPVPPLADLATSLPPPPPFVEPVAPPVPSATESVATPPPKPPTQQVAENTKADLVLSHSSPSVSANAVGASVLEPLTTLPAPTPAHTEQFTPASCHASDLVETVTPLAPPPLTQSIASPPSVIKPIAPSNAVEPLPSHVPKSESPSSPPIFKPITILPAYLLPSGDSLPLQSAESLPSAPLPEFTASCEPVAPPPQLTAEPLSPAPAPESVAVPQSSPVSPPAVPPAVNEEALRKKITDELYKDLAQKRAEAEQDMQAWYDAEKARASAQAQADAQSKVQDEISRILSVERAFTQESLQQAIIRERISSEDEKLRAQLLAKQLEAKEADLKKQDAFYREQVARLEERSVQFYKVNKENYHKAVDQVNAKFKRYEVHPVCGDLQGQILSCYKDNTGKTLNCSNIAALYLQCVNNAKQNDQRVHASSWNSNITS